MFTTAHNSFARLPDSFCSTRRILGIFKLEFIGLWVRAKELSDMQSHSDAARRNVREKSVFFVFSQIRFFLNFMFQLLVEIYEIREYLCHTPISSLRDTLLQVLVAHRMHIAHGIYGIWPGQQKPAQKSGIAQFKSLQSKREREA